MPGRGGDRVVVLGRYGRTMNHGGALLDSPFCHVYRFDGDKAVTLPPLPALRSGRD